MTLVSVVVVLVVVGLLLSLINLGNGEGHVEEQTSG
jgi:hypothetical protein